jgi:formate-dependent nitrite reductase membrane component NrfD
MSAEGATVPRAKWDSYYGRPVLKAPVWKPEIPFYFFTGGLGGASAMLALLAEARGNDELARRAWLNALAGVGASPALLISDLGKPSRFVNMLRVFKVTSPMSVGSWLLSASGLATAVAAADAWTPYVPAPAGRVARVAAAVCGMPLTTYTAALIANTAVPVWHEARVTLPFVFAASGATSAGAAAVLATPPRAAAPARRLAIGGAVATAAAVELMRHRLGDAGEPYREGASGTLKRAAMALSVTGAGLVAGLGRRRPAAVAGGALLLAGAICERWSVFRAGFQSAADPKYTVGPQRSRIAAGARRGATRAAGVANPG